MKEHKNIELAFSYMQHRKHNFNHSNYLYETFEGHCFTGYNLACLADLTQRTIPPMEKAFIFLPRKKGGDKWVDYVLNRSLFEECFITKDIEEGFDRGFELNLDCPKVVSVAGLMAIRHFVEFDEWSWESFLGLGFSETDSYFLANSLYESCGVLYDHLENPNHKVYYVDFHYKNFYKIPKKVEQKTFREGTKGYFEVSSSWSGNPTSSKDLLDIKGLEHFTKTSSSVFGNEIGEGVKFNKENLEKILRFAKGK